jgi:large subunit ribosomal protein L24
MKSRQPRKTRKEWYTAPLHRRRKQVAAHLSEELLVKYNRRSIPVRKGDTVKVLRGAFKGLVEKVATVDTKSRKITVEKAIIVKADGKQVAKPIDPSNVIITKLNLSDPWRRRKLEEGMAPSSVPAKGADEDKSEEVEE